MMDYAQYTNKIQALELQESKALSVLRKFPKNMRGITPDEVKFSNDYKAAKANYQRIFKAMRELNGSVPIEYKRKRSRLYISQG